jgi:hypothetical protein
MVLDVPGAKLAAPADLYAGEGVRAMKPFVFCTVRRVLGRTDAFAKAVRYIGLEKGYKDRLRPAVELVPPGSLLYDLGGGLVGLCIRERRERELSGLTRRRRIYMRADELKNLLPFARLKAALQAPAKHSLPTWRPMTAEEAKRLVWLGVEFDPITRDLAKRLRVEEPTCSGAVGLMVSTVYPGSPAARLGIEPRDILLHLEVKGMGDPLALASAGAASGGSMFGRMMGMGGAMGDEGAARTWKPRANVLTMLLTDAGPGHDAEITYYSHRRKKTFKGGFRLAYGPADYDSAEKHKDERLGLWLKPLTYEVRRALAMGPRDPGVIICKVEEGSPARLARLQPYTVVTHVDNQPVTSTAEFAEVVSQLRKAKKDKVKLQVSVMGKSRFADLKLK